MDTDKHLKKEIAMNKLILSLFLTFIFSLPTFITANKSYALDNPVLMFFGQKEFPESLSRKSRVFKQTLAEITDVLLQEYDLEVKDEMAASADTYEDKGGRRDKAELAGVARESDCDIAVLFQVTPWVEDKGGYKKVRAQINLAAFFVDASARSIGHVDVSSEIPVKIRSPFKKPQIMEAAAEAAKDVAAQAADELGQQILAHLDKRKERGGVYTIVFKKFKTGEIEDTIDAFSTIDGYVSHRQLRKTSRMAKVEYRSTVDMASLTSEFDLILKDLNISSSTSTRGNDIILSKVRVRRSRR